MNDYGQLYPGTMVRFERALTDPIELVWYFLTKSEYLSGWLREGTVKPRSGGAVNIRGGHIRGAVTQWRTPLTLTHALRLDLSD